MDIQFAQLPHIETALLVEILDCTKQMDITSLQSKFGVQLI